MNVFFEKRTHLDAKRSAFAKATHIKGSVQKLNLVAGLIRGVGVFNASLQLRHCTKKLAEDVLQVLNSAVSNAENNYSLDIDRLYVSEVLVGPAFAFKRHMARGRGRSAAISKKYSKLTLVVSERGA